MEFNCLSTRTPPRWCRVYRLHMTAKYSGLILFLAWDPVKTAAAREDAAPAGPHADEPLVPAGDDRSVPDAVERKYRLQRLPGDSFRAARYQCRERIEIELIECESLQVFGELL